MKYKVHIGYITAEGRTILPGVYDESELDLMYARNRSIITAVDASVTTSTVENPLNEITTLTFNPENTSLTTDVTVLELNPTKTVIQVEKLNINSATSNQIEDLKYVGKATATKVITQREEKLFTSYDDLNKRVPLAKAKKWEDIAIIEFILPKQIDNESTIRLI